MKESIEKNIVTALDEDVGNGQAVEENAEHEEADRSEEGSPEKTGNVKDRPKRKYFDRYDKIFVSALAIFCVLILAFKLTQHPILVFGSSMSPTYTDGELLTSSVDFTEQDIQYDSIVAFKSHDKGKRLYIKRVVGMPGDALEIRDGILYVNGMPEDRSFEYIAGDMQPTVVPEGSYFVMGDNRNNSRDSRAFGAVKFEDITHLIKVNGFRFRCG